MFPLPSCIHRSRRVSPPMLSGYGYRAYLPINGSSVGAQTSYQMPLTVAVAAGANVAGTIYTNGNEANWPNDVVFTKGDGQTLLDFYIEESDAVDGTWWIEVPNVPGGVYIYYGNAAAVNTSNGANTFLFFDDVETGDLTKWTGTSATFAANNVTKYEGTWSIKYTDPLAAGASYGYYRFPSDITGVAVIGYIRRTGNSNTWDLFCWWDHVTGKFVYPLFTNDFAGGTFTYYNGTGHAVLPTNKSWAVDTWYKVHYAMDFNTSPPKIRWLYVKDGDAGSANMKDDSNAVPTILGKNLMFYAYGTGGDGYWDQIMVRKYVYPEPTWSTPGVEETS